MTRLRTLLATTVAILACASLGVPAQGAVTHNQGAGARGTRVSTAIVRENTRRHEEQRVKGYRSAPRQRDHKPHRAPTPRKVGPPSGAGLARAVTISRVLATPCPNTQLTPEPSNLGPIRAAVLCLVNRERAQNGETPLALNAQLQRAAEGHTSEMISSNYFEHVSPNGLTPVDRVRGTGYIPSPQVGYVIGENLAWGTLSLATPEAIVAAWIASPGHLANILESQYQDTGIAVAAEVPAALSNGAPGATYTQEFGVILR